MRASVFTLSLVCSLYVHAESSGELDVLRARSNEQERQIRNLETEIETLHSQLALERRRVRTGRPAINPEIVRSDAKLKTYVVGNGDTLSSIARKHRSSVSILMEENDIKDPSRLRAGQTITLPPMVNSPSPSSFFKKTPPKAIPVLDEERTATSSAHATPPKRVPRVTNSYQVERGDTLYGIARRHGMSVETLRAMNPEIDDRILVGQTITMTGGNDTLSSDKKPRTPNSVSLPQAKETTPISPEAITYKPVQTNRQLTKQATAGHQRSARGPKPALSAVDLKSVNEEAGSATKRISSVFVSEEVTFDDFARRHGTTPEQLNALNGWDFRGSLLLARGSEIYVPGS